MPFHGDLIEPMIDDAIQHIQEIGFQQWENDLRLGISHSRIEFQYIRLSFYDHQSGVQYALEGTA